MVSVGVPIGRVKNFESDAREILSRRYAIKHDSLVAGQGSQELCDRRIATIDEEGVIPHLDDMAHGDLLDFGEVHHHTVVRLAGGLNDLSGERDFQRIAMPVQMTALALMVGNAVAGVEFEAAGDLHKKEDNPRAENYSLAPPSFMSRLSVLDHNRNAAGMTYVYPVVSRRAGGVSVGINLNPNNACNWRCIYCQVPDLQRGGPPPIDLTQLEAELREMLTQLYRGDYLELHAPPEARRVVDIAFSGNGEPTSAAEFPAAVALVGRILDSLALSVPPRIRLITNGSLLDREDVQAGIAKIGLQGGEVWFKVDRVDPARMKQINGVGYEPATVLRRLKRCGELCETWVQTCWFALDGQPVTAAEQDAYLDFLMASKDCVAGVHLYGLARPSMQAEASRLSALPAAQLECLAAQIRQKIGLTVLVSP